MRVNYCETVVDLKCKKCGYKTTNIKLRTWNWQQVFKKTDINFDDYLINNWICPNCKELWNDL